MMESIKAEQIFQQEQKFHRGVKIKRAGSKSKNGGNFDLEPAKEKILILFHFTSGESNIIHM